MSVEERLRQAGLASSSESDSDVDFDFDASSGRGASIPGHQRGSAVADPSSATPALGSADAPIPIISPGSGAKTAKTPSKRARSSGSPRSGASRKKSRASPSESVDPASPVVSTEVAEKFLAAPTGAPPAQPQWDTIIRGLLLNPDWIARTDASKPDSVAVFYQPTELGYFPTMAQLSIVQGAQANRVRSLRAASRDASTHYSASWLYGQIEATIRPWDVYRDHWPAPITYEEDPRGTSPLALFYQENSLLSDRLLRLFWYRTHHFRYQDYFIDETSEQREQFVRIDMGIKNEWSRRMSTSAKVMKALAAAIQARDVSPVVLLDPNSFILPSLVYPWEPDLRRGALGISVQLADLDRREPWRSAYTVRPETHPIHRFGFTSRLANQFPLAHPPTTRQHHVRLPPIPPAAAADVGDQEADST